MHFIYKFMYIYFSLYIFYGVNSMKTGLGLSPQHQVQSLAHSGSSKIHRCVLLLST